MWDKKIDFNFWKEHVKIVKMTAKDSSDKLELIFSNQHNQKPCHKGD